MYNLDLEGKSVVWIEAPMLVVQNNVRNEELQTILESGRIGTRGIHTAAGIESAVFKKGYVPVGSDSSCRRQSSRGHSVMEKILCSRRWKCMRCNIITGNL
mgnify:CR=1 FL=1